jgi:hypothetical protein
MPEARYAHTVNELNGKIYVVGGATYENTFYPRTALVYDTSSGIWTTIPLCNGKIRAAHGSCVVGGKLYVVGGNDSGRTISTMDMFDPSSGQWVSRNSMPTDRGLAACVSIGSKIYVMGGMRYVGNPFSDLSGLTTVEVYDTNSGTWTQSADMPTPRWGHSAVAMNGKIYVFGGRAGGAVYSSVEVYSPQTDTWTTRSAMPTRRYCLTACLLDSTIYTLGGWLDSGGGPIYDKVEVYHPESDTFHTEVPIPVARAVLASSVLGGRIFIYGGSRTTHPNAGTSAIYEFDRYPWFAHDVRLTRVGRDTLRITARAQNQLSHTLEVIAILKDEAGVLIDSLSLKDDGLHADGASADGLWGNQFVPVWDDTICVSIRTNDQTAGTTRTLPNVLTYIFTRGAIISVDTRTLDLGRISVATSRYDTTFLVRNIGYTWDSLTVSVDPGNVYPDTAVGAAPTLFALASGDSQKVTFSVRAGMLSPAYYSAEVIVKSKSAFGQTEFGKSYQFQVVISSISDIAGLPIRSALNQNHPNPFNPSTTITFELPKSSEVQLSVYDMLGREVSMLVNDRRDAGVHEVRFDGSGLSSGMYIYRFRAGEYLATRRMILMK